MPSTTTQVPKAQPWKAHWSPKAEASDTTGKEYLASSTGDVIVDGIIFIGVQGGSSTRSSELACSDKSSTPVETPKAQPWKAHWSPENNKNASPTADREYAASSNGNVIVDGQEGGSPDLFFELACSNKSSQTTEGFKAQPWKAHWSPNKNASRTGDMEHIASSTGDVIIDGLHPPYDLCELACSSKPEEK